MKLHPLNADQSYCQSTAELQHERLLTVPGALLLCDGHLCNQIQVVNHGLSLDLS